MGDATPADADRLFEEFTCRLCLSCNVENLDIFGPSGQGDTLDAKISKHLSFKVLPSDELPKWICAECQHALNSFHTFYARADQAQEQLKHLLINANSTSLSVEGTPVVKSLNEEESAEDTKPVRRRKSVNEEESAEDTKPVRRSKSVNEEESADNTKPVRRSKSVNEEESAEDTKPVRRSRRCKTRRKSYRSLALDEVKEEPADEQEIGAEARMVETVLNDCPVQNDLVFPKDSDLSSHEDQEWILTDFNFIDDDSNDSGNDNTWKPSSFTRTSRRKCSMKKSLDIEPTKQEKKRRRRGVKRGALEKPKNEVESIEESEEIGEDEPQQKKLRITATHGTMPKPKLPPGSRKLVRARMNAMMMQFYGLTCDICVNNSGNSQTPVEPFKYQTFEALCDHMQKAHDERGYVKCCNCTMRERKRAERHMLLHTQPGSVYKCNICGKQLSSQQSFRCHILLHLPDSERPHQCTQCERGFVTKSDLIQHEHQHLPEDKRFSYTCDICGSRFSYESGLMIHKQRVHENARSHLCDICAKIFNSRCDMERHREQIHGNVKRELCPDCGKWFKGPSILKTHMRQHRGVVYQCQFCDKKYTVRSSWKAHLLRHSDDKPHKCPMCEKSFKLPGTLKMHLNQHTGELPYSCPFCPKKFASSGNYYTHRKRMHREEVAEMKKATEASLASSGLLPPVTVPPPNVTRTITEAIAHAKEKAASRPPAPARAAARAPPRAPATLPRAPPAPPAYHSSSAADIMADTTLLQATSVVPTAMVTSRSVAVSSHIGMGLINSLPFPLSHPNSQSHGSTLPTLVVSIPDLTQVQIVPSVPSAPPPVPNLTSNLRIMAPGVRVLQSEALMPGAPLQARAVPQHEKPLDLLSAVPLALDCKLAPEDIQAEQEV